MELHTLTVVMETAEMLGVRTPSSVCILRAFVGTSLRRPSGGPRPRFLSNLGRTPTACALPLPQCTAGVSELVSPKLRHIIGSHGLTKSVQHRFVLLRVD